MYNRGRNHSCRDVRWSYSQMILESLFEKRASLENPSTSLSDPDNWLYHAFGAVPTDADIVVSERNATTITAFWSAVNTISDTIGLLPLKLIQTKRDGSHKEIRNHHAAVRLKLSPNDVMTAAVYKSTLQAHTLTWGNSYSMIVRNPLDEVLSLWPLSPSLTKPKMENRRLIYHTKIENEQVQLPANEVLHIPALSREGLLGMSIVHEQREMLGSALATQKFGSKFFANGAKPGGLLSFPGKIKDPDKLRKHVEDQYSGNNAHGLLVADGGAEFKSFSVPPDDAQFLGTREFSVDEIGRMFRLPLHFLNKMGQATFNNLEMMGSHFVQYTMMPWIKRWEEELTRKLLNEKEIKRGLAFKFNVSALVRGDIKTRSELYTKGISSGWMTRNEVRGLEEMNPLEGLDDPLVPLNMTAVGDEPDEPDEPDAETETDDEEKTRQMTNKFERLLRKERKHIYEMIEANGSQSELGEALSLFYTKHKREMADTLGWSEDQCDSFVRNHGTQILDASGRDEVNSVLKQWEKAGINYEN